MKKRILGFGVAVAALLASAPIANAQTMLSRAVISSAGGHATNGQTSSDITFAEPITGQASNGTTVMHYGFWAPNATTAGVSANAVLPTSMDLKVWPNPAIGETRLALTVPKSMSVTITLTDAAGHQLMSKAVEQNAGTSSIPLDLSGLSNGAYFVLASIPGEIVQQRLNVIR